MVTDLGASDVILESEPRLVPLLARSFPQITVIARSDPPAPQAARAATQIAAGSLGQYLRAEAAAFPRRDHYLRADTARAREFRARLLGADKTSLIGISWVSKNRAFGARKTCALKEMEPLWQAAGADTRFVDLQYGDTAAERAAAGLDLAHLPDLDLTHDIDGLAALIAACDMVITVSNTTAHLAGALGVPTCVLIAKGSGRLWYWGPSPSPWYPQATLFKQSEVGPWDEVIAHVCARLRSAP